MKPAEELAEIEVALQDMNLEDKELTDELENLCIPETLELTVADRLVRADEIAARRRELEYERGSIEVRRNALNERKSKLEVLVFDEEVKAFIKVHNAGVRRLRKKSREYNAQLSSLCDVGQEVKEILNNCTIPRKYREHHLVMDQSKCLPAPGGAVFWGIPGKNETLHMRLPEGVAQNGR